MKMNRNEMEALYAFGCPEPESNCRAFAYGSCPCTRSSGEEAVLYAFRQAEC